MEGIISALTNPTDPTDLAAWGDYLGAFDGAVDGRYAMNAEQVRLLVNAETWRQAMALVVPNAQGGRQACCGSTCPPGGSGYPPTCQPPTP